jgi:NitT/TauT family transport system permease protein
MDLNPHPSAPQPRRSVASDVFVLFAILAGLVSLIQMGQQWHQPFKSEVAINLSPWYLPYYTMLSLGRGVAAYVLSFIFTLLYARWAAYDRQAERVLIPLLDILQSIPLAAFLAPIEIFLVGLFPHSEIGLELTCIVVIFTGQVWNMTFSFYYSLKGLPADFAFVGKLARFTPWQKFTQIELPFAAKGLVYNSMVSMAGGWFFLSIIEAFQLGDQDYRVPGIGSYMSVAKEQKDGWAQCYAVIAIVIMIVTIDQFVWRPLIVWSNRFKIEDTESEFQDRSAVLRFLTRSRVFAWIGEKFSQLLTRPAPVASEVARKPVPVVVAPRTGPLKYMTFRSFFLILAIGLVGFGAVSVVKLLWEVTLGDWTTIVVDLLCTLIRVLAAIALSTVIAVPIGVWIGSNPKLARFLMPITQIAASFPSPLVFSNLFALIVLIGGNLAWGSVILMMLGTIWYILFNVISGATAIPQDLKACTQLTHLGRWQQWRTLWLPGIFPALTTGWITAAGGAWNASIVSEYLQDHNPPLETRGLGSYISDMQAQGHFPQLAASVLAMALFVVFFNRMVWKRLSAIAQDRYQLIT